MSNTSKFQNHPAPLAQAIQSNKVKLLIFALSLNMAGVVFISNLLVAHPLNFTLFGYNFDGWFTAATFSFPVAFLLTDVTNRVLGAGAARIAVMAGFVVGVLMSIYFGDPRIGIASGAAYLCGQFLDIWLFDRLRSSAGITSFAFWRAPLVSSFFASLIDTALFYTLAFAAIPLLGLQEAFPGWEKVAVGDFSVKILMALVLLIPYASMTWRLMQYLNKADT